MTNNGQYLQQFEEDLKSYLGVKYCVVVANATSALMIVMRAMGLKGKVIVPSFTFLAVPHSVSWCGLEPVFCDVEKSTWGLDPQKAESLITTDTSAIIAVMPYGTPLDIKSFEKLADQNNLKLIFDSAAAFGATDQDKFLGGNGNAEVFSFHATKLFTTFEGGAITTNDETLYNQAKLLRNFGFEGETQISACGMNAKMHELSAAFGIEGLKLMGGKKEKLRNIALRYKNNLSGIPGLSFQKVPEGAEPNNSSFPIRICPEEFGRTRDEVYQHYLSHNIYSRRYFYPPCHWFDHYRNNPCASKENLKVTEQLCQEILCLPIFVDLQLEDVDRISEVLINFAGNHANRS